jgi:hypothetical protein
VAGNLVATSRIHLSRADRADVVLAGRFPRSLEDLRVAAGGAGELLRLGLRPAEIAFFARKMLDFARTKPEDRIVYEDISWWDFVEADRFGEDYHRHFCHGLTRSMVAMSPRLASTRTFGTIFLQMMMDIADPRRVFDRVLAGPTNEMWTVPWLRHLQRLGVELHRGRPVRRFDLEDGRVTRAHVDGIPPVEADAYVLAVPVERAVEVLDAPVVAADPRLALLSRIRTAWMVGIQFYLRGPLDLVDGDRPAGDRGGGAPPDAPLAGRSLRPGGRERRWLVPLAEHPLRSGRGRERRAPRDQHGRELGRAAGCPDRREGPVPRFRLCPYHHGHRLHGGGERGGAARGGSHRCRARGRGAGPVSAPGAAVAREVSFAGDPSGSWGSTGSPRPRSRSISTETTSASAPSRARRPCR